MLRDWGLGRQDLGGGSGIAGKEAGDEGEHGGGVERDTVVVGSGFALMAAAGSRSCKAEGDLFLSELGVLQKDTEEDRTSFCQIKAPPEKRSAVIRVESADAQDYVSAPPLTRRMEQKIDIEDES